MPSEFSIPQIVQFANISQYLAANEKSSLTQLKSGSIIGNLSTQLYMEGYLLQNMLALNPNGSTIRGTGEYVLSLCGKYLQQAQAIVGNLVGTKPIITGPSNQSGLVGFNAVFSVSVVSSTTVSYQWFRGGAAIPGAVLSSLTIPNAQLTDSGSTFFVVATNAAGQQVSGTATLTVTQALTGFFAFNGTTDYFPILQGNSDPFTYPTTFPITSGQPFVITLPPAMPSNQYMLIKAPIGQPIKTVWANSTFNSGNIPDSSFENVLTFGGFNYYASRGQITMNVTGTLTMT